MTTQKRAISIPAELGDAVDALVRSGAAPSFSAFVTTAVQQRLDRDTALTVLRTHTGGPAGGEYRRRAERLLGVSPSRGSEEADRTEPTGPGRHVRPGVTTDDDGGTPPRRAS